MSNRFDRWPSAFEGWNSASKPGEYDETYTREFSWRSPDRRRSFREITLELPVDVYDYCTNRARIQEYGVYVSDPFQEPVLESVIDGIRDAAGSSDDVVSEAIAFVQSLDYTRDLEDTGHRAYPKYPIETLVHGQGDCEDGTTLLGALLHHLGYDVVVLLLPDEHHMLLGIAVDDHVESRIEYGGTSYAPLETTAPGWEPGEIPPEYANATLQVQEVTDKPVLVHEWNAAPKARRTVELTLHVANFGDAVAEPIQANLMFRRRNGDVVARTALMNDATIHTGRSVKRSESLRLRPNHKLQGVCRLGIGGQLHDESESSWR